MRLLSDIDLFNVLAPGNAQLVIVDEDGNEQIFYDNKAGRNEDNIQVASVYFLIIAVQGIVLIYVFRHKRKTGEWPKWKLEYDEKRRQDFIYSLKNLRNYS